MSPLCSKPCNDGPSVSELKPESLEWSLLIPTRTWTLSPTSTSLAFMPPYLSLNILSTLSSAGLCTPELTDIFRSVSLPSFTSLFKYHFLSEAFLDFLMQNYNCPLALPSSPPCSILCVLFLYSTCHHHLTFLVFYFVYCLSPQGRLSTMQI